MSEELTAALYRAWNDEGKCPKYHRAQKARLMREWPTLAVLMNTLTAEVERKK